ncbi:hypothetical protein BURPS1710b_0305 [Burkholderia pseudomallei 1710b]|uniref:Uncharacterized protein n=1 Tax=Burkholderia pseudomallei (strain 1710b) TaxID=320372 RepID=Q3JXI2_BURP1|nr:hypothetical protein BURPS1710b_0305 [Burkholderia pseudomallei 1710b]
MSAPVADRNLWHPPVKPSLSWAKHNPIGCLPGSGRTAQSGHADTRRKSGVHRTSQIRLVAQSRKSDRRDGTRFAFQFASSRRASGFSANRAQMADGPHDPDTGQAPYACRVASGGSALVALRPAAERGAHHAATAAARRKVSADTGDDRARVENRGALAASSVSGAGADRAVLRRYVQALSRAAVSTKKPPDENRAAFFILSAEMMSGDHARFTGAAQKRSACAALFRQAKASARLFLRRGAAERARDVVLLRDRQHVVHHVVQHEAGREEEEHHRERDRHEHHHLRLNRVRGSRVQLRLHEHRDGHQHRQDEVWVALRQVVNPQNPRRAAHFDRREQHPVQRDEHRNLDHHRQAAAKRVHLLRLVQFHQRRVHLLRIALEAFAQRLHPRRDFLHPRHRLVARRRQREEHRLDQQREQHDRPAPIADEAVNLLEQPEQRLRDDRHPAVILHELQARRDAFEHPLFLRAGEQARGHVGRLARRDRRDRLLHADAVQRRVDLLDVDVALRARLWNPGGREVVLNHRDPAVVGGRDVIGLVLVDVAERDLLEVLLIRVHRRPEERMREHRRLDRRVVAHELHVYARRHGRGADVLDLRVDADHVAAARERVRLHHLHAALHRRFERQLQRVLVGRERRRAGHLRIDVVVIREIAAEQARAREIRVVRRVIEQRHRQVGLLAVARLRQRQLRERAAARVDLAIVDVGREAHELRLRRRRGRRGGRARRGRRQRIRRRRRARARRAIAVSRVRRGVRLRDVREEHRRASVGPLPVVEQHDR